MAYPGSKDFRKQPVNGTNALNHDLAVLNHDVAVNEGGAPVIHDR